MLVAAFGAGVGAVVSGAIGGVAVVNTYALVMASVPSPQIEHYAMAIGAATLAGLAKVVHAV